MTAAVMLLLWYVTVDRAENCDTSLAMLDTVHKEANEDDMLGEAGSLPKRQMSGKGGEEAVTGLSHWASSTDVFMFILSRYAASYISSGRSQSWRRL